MLRNPAVFLAACAIALRAFGLFAHAPEPAAASASATSAAQGPAEAEVYFHLVVVSTADAAQAVKDRIARGENMEAIARTDSIDPSAAQDGLIGPVALSVLRPELRDALQGLAPGEIGPIVRVPNGYAVVRRARGMSNRPRIGAGEIPGLAAVGSVQPTASVDGFVEANTVLQDFPKASVDWNQDLQEICRARRQSLVEIGETMSALVRDAATTGTLGAVDLMQAHVVLGQLHAYDGRMNEAIVEFERARPLAEKAFAAGVSQVDEMLGIAHLHRGGMDNGVFRAPDDRCLLSSTPTPFARTGDAEKAMAYFRTVLASRPDDVEARWLLNLAAMSAGAYPAKLSSTQLIPPSVFASVESIGRFTDVAASAGVESFAWAGGVVVDDFDNDGSLDILTSSFDSCGAMQLFSRGPDRRFRDRAAAAGLGGQLGGLNLSQADYNNDGCRDVLVMRGGWEIAQRRSLLRNNCDGTFTDVTAAAGLARPATSSQTAVWADIDNDGFIDLFSGNEGSPSQLFRNKADGTFEDIGPAAGVARQAFTKGVAAADIDNDGDVDLYVSNLGGGNFLYRNNGNRTFTEQAVAAGVPGADRGFPTWFFDYDNDGWEDLLVSSYYLSVDESARTYLGLPVNANTMRLYKNVNGRFRDVTAQAGLNKVYMPMGSNFGDLDNDGFLDIYLGTGSPSYGALVPSVLLHNKGGSAFVDVTASSGTGELHKGHGVAIADLDRDGDAEIVFRVGGATPGDAHAFRLFDNPGQGNDWLHVELVGVKSNRAAIGARLSVTVTDASGTRRVMHRTVSSGGSFGASPLAQHVGLGRGARRVDIDVRWPASGTRQSFMDVSKNSAVRIREMADRIEPLNRPPVPFGVSRAR